MRVKGNPNHDQVDQFIAFCCLLASPVQYRRAESQQDFFSAVEVGFTCGCSGRSLSPPGPRPSGVRVRYATGKALVLVNAMQCTVLPHITASVFINDDEGGLHADYEKWLEEVCRGLLPAPHAPTSHCRPGGRRPTGRLHNRTGEDACPRRRDRLPTRN
jgi:hypothetical protein